MNLLKLYSVLFIVLLVCTLESDGGIIIGLLIKLIALKGALFLGTPIALGAFLMGQGVGFFAGNLAGGYAVLRTAQKFHEREKAKWKSPSHGWEEEDKYYNKGFGIGTIIANLLNKHKGWKPVYKGWQPEYKGWEPDYHDYGHHDYDYHGHGHGGHGYESSPPKTHFHYYPSPSHGHHSSYAPSHSYQSSYSGSTPYYGAPSFQSHHIKPPPTIMERIIGRIPGISTIFGSDKGHAAPKGPIYTPGKPPAHTEFDPYGYGKYPSAFNTENEYKLAQASYDGVPYSFQGQDPSNTFQPGIFASPSKGSSPLYKHQSSGYSFKEGYKAALASESHAADDYESSPGSSYEYSPNHSPSSLKTSYQDDKYLPQGEDGYDDSFPGAGSSYDGPAKQYTGVMTDIYSKIQSSRPKGYGKPIGKPMGPEDYVESEEYADNGQFDSDGQASHHVAELLSNANRNKRKNKKGISKETPKYHNSVAAPNHILEKYLESKLEEQATKAKDDEQRKEAKELIKLLKQVYMQQLAASMKSESVTDKPSNFAQFPSIPNSTKPSAPTMSTTTTRIVVDTPTSTTPRTPIITTSSPFRPTSEPTKFIHVSTVSWRKLVEPKVLSLTGIDPFFPEATSSRHKREGKPDGTEQKKGDDGTSVSNGKEQLSLNPEQLQQLQMLVTFMEEIKQFFTLVSILDQDTCLQKMVCDVHANMASGAAQPKLSEYESNLISTFRLMDTLIPLDPSAPEDSSTKYRLAAKLGELSKSTESCKTYYSLCAYSSDQIMNLGSQVEASQTQGVPEFGSGTQEEPATAESMSMSVSALSSTATVTAMPRV